MGYFGTSNDTLETYKITISGNDYALPTEKFATVIHKSVGNSSTYYHMSYNTNVTPNELVVKTFTFESVSGVLDLTKDLSTDVESLNNSTTNITISPSSRTYSDANESLVYKMTDNGDNNFSVSHTYKVIKYKETFVGYYDTVTMKTLGTYSISPSFYSDSITVTDKFKKVVAQTDSSMLDIIYITMNYSGIECVVEATLFRFKDQQNQVNLTNTDTILLLIDSLYTKVVTNGEQPNVLITNLREGINNQISWSKSTSIGSNQYEIGYDQATEFIIDGELLGYDDTNQSTNVFSKIRNNFDVIIGAFGFGALFGFSASQMMHNMRHKKVDDQ